ncbi:MAG: ribose 5-phosphate isomerase B [Anaerolineae bacterium]
MIDESEVRKMVRNVVEQTLGMKGTSQPQAISQSSTAGRVGVTERASAPPAAPKRKVIGQEEMMEVARGETLYVPPGAIVTPLARDMALERRITIVTEPGAPPPVEAPHMAARIVAIGADHAGFTLKEQLKGYVVELGHSVKDCGTFSEEAVDYPDFAYAVARLVSEGKAWRGIIVDGAGIGSCMAANKVTGVRAAMCYDVSTAVNSREHNDANVLTLGAQLLGLNLAKQIVKAWLATDFGGNRHERRVNKVMDLERLWKGK